MYWYDGNLIDSCQLQLEVNEPGLCYGATSFSTMRVYDCSLDHPLTSWQSHCDRLQAAITAFDWQPPDWHKLRQGAEILLEHFAVLRLTIFADGKEWVTGRNLPFDLAQRQAKGITAWIAQDSLYRRELPQYKTGNYLSAYLSRERALKFKAQEAILVDTQGNWLETSTGNLWGWQDNCWYTPNLDSGILPGIARSRWLQFFRHHQVAVQENIWTPEFVAQLEALAYSNCVVDFVPIKSVFGREKRTIYALKRP